MTLDGDLLPSLVMAYSLAFGSAPSEEVAVTRRIGVNTTSLGRMRGSVIGIEVYPS
jgi:hypothetical protein